MSAGLLFDPTQALVEELGRERSAPRQRSKAVGLHAYASEAGGCSRQIGLRLLNAPAGGSFDDSSVINMALGSFLHGKMQDSAMRILLAHWKAVGVSFTSSSLGPRLDEFVAFELSWAIPSLSGRADGLYVVPEFWEPTAPAWPGPEARALLEIKSMNSNSFTGALSYGPQSAHVLQASLSAEQLGADYVHMAYINKLPRRGEPAGVDWLLPVDVQTTSTERIRLVSIVEQVQDGMVPACEWGGRVISPETQRGWPCQYCPFTAVCLELGPGAQPAPTPVEFQAMLPPAAEEEPLAGAVV